MRVGLGRRWIVIWGGGCYYQNQWLELCLIFVGIRILRPYHEITKVFSYYSRRMWATRRPSYMQAKAARLDCGG